MADIRYYDIGFIDEGYMDDTIDTTGYYLEGYMTDDYISLASSSGEVKEGECLMVCLSGQTVTPSKIMSTTVVLIAFNEVDMTVSAIKNNFAILTSSSSLLATVSKIASNVITLDTIVNQSLQGDITRQLNLTTTASFTSTNTSIATKEFTSNFADAFSLTASLDVIGVTLQLSASLVWSATVNVSGIKPTRITTFVNSTSPVFDPIQLDSSVYKFGSGGYRKDVSGNEETPDRCPVWDGTYWRMFENNYQWTSTNLSTWTRSSNNLPVTVTGTITDVEYISGSWILATDQVYYTSSDSTATWTEIDIDSAYEQGFSRSTTDSMSQTKIVYAHSKWWIISQRGIYYKSSLSDTGWSELTYYPTFSNAQLFVGGLSHNSNQVVFGSYTYPSGYGYFNNTVRKITVNSNSNIVNVDAFSGSEQAIPSGYSIRRVETAQDNNEIYYVIGITNNTAFELRTVGQTSAKLTNSYGFGPMGRLNGKYYYTAIDADGAWTTYFGNSFATATALDYPVTTYDGIRYENGYYLYIHDDHLVYSSNGTTWTYELIDDLLSLNNRGLAYTNTSLSNWKSIDFWGRFTKLGSFNNTSYPLFRIGQTEFYLYEFDGSRTAIRAFDYNENNFNTYSTLFDNALITNPHTNNTYNNHIRIIRNGDDFKAYLNGALSLEATVEGSLTSNTLTLGMGQWGSSFDNKVYLDEFYVSTELLNDYSDDTITIPTTTWSNDEDAALLLHFDGTFEDFVEPPTVVNLSASFTLSATATADKGLVALFATLGTLTTNATSTRELESTQVSTTTIDALGQRFKQFNAVLDAHTSVLATGITVTNTEFSVTANTALIANTSIQRNVTPLFESVATTVTITSKIADMFVNVNTTATMIVDAVSITGNIVTLNSPATMTTVPGTIARTIVVCPATTTLIATPIKIQKLSLNKTATATQVTDAFKVAQGTSTISGSMIFNFGVNIGRVGDINAYAQFSMDVVAQRKRNINLDLTSVISSQITVSKTVEVNTILDVITSQLTTGRISHLLEIVYTIPSEDRIFTIHKEDRTHAIFNEDRTYKIGE